MERITLPLTAVDIPILRRIDELLIEDMFLIEETLSLMNSSWGALLLLAFQRILIIEIGVM